MSTLSRSPPTRHWRRGRAAGDPTLARIGAKHGVPASQVAIAWLLDQDHVIAIPKAERRESQQTNLDALSLRLDDEDRASIAELPKDLRFVQPPFARDWDTEQGLTQTLGDASARHASFRNRDALWRASSLGHPSPGVPEAPGRP